MKFVPTFISFFFICLLSHAQFENRYWIMGYENFTNPTFGGFSLDFINNQPDTIRIDRQLNVMQGTSSISSKDGRFIIATNGAKVGDSNNQIMMNGDSLICLAYCSPADGGSNVWQSNIIIPDPADTNLYYLFYSPAELLITNSAGAINYPLHMYYAKIDMRLNGGAGAVTSKNISLLDDTLQVGKITACKHANGRDWWLVFKDYHTDDFLMYLISPSGIQFVHRQLMGVGKQQTSYVCFSPDGSRYANYDLVYGLQIYDFDRCSGNFSNPIYIPYTDSVQGVGVAFSPSSRFVYTTTINSVYQYDLLASNIENSKTLVGLWDGAIDVFPVLTTHFWTMGLARDGKIYIVTGNGTHYIHRINYPDNLGSACNFQQRIVYTPTYYFRSVPNHPNYNLGPELFSVCDTLTGISELSGKYNFKTFPNPVSKGKKIFIEFNHVGIQEGIFTIYDIHGKTVLTQPISAFTSLLEVDIPESLSGLYLINLKFEDWEESDKLIIE